MSRQISYSLLFGVKSAGGCDQIRCIAENTFSLMMLISTPIASAVLFISARRSSIEISAPSRSTIIIITKFPERIVCEISAILTLCSARKPLTFAIMPTLSEPTTVIIAFIRFSVPHSEYTGKSERRAYQGFRIIKQ